MFGSIAAYVKKTAATKQDTTANIAEAASEKLKKGAMDAANVSMKATLLTTLAITGAVVALTLIIWGIVAAFKEWKASTPEE